MSKSATSTEVAMNPVTPGDILLEEFILPAGLSQTGLAKALGAPPRRINETVLGKAGDHRRHRHRPAPSPLLGMSEGFFLRLQTGYDLRVQRAKMGDVLEMIRPRAA